jgi:hypothetical protein
MLTFSRSLAVAPGPHTSRGRGFEEASLKLPSALLPTKKGVRPPGVTISFLNTEAEPVHQ